MKKKHFERLHLIIFTLFFMPAFFLPLDLDFTKWWWDMIVVVGAILLIILCTLSDLFLEMHRKNESRIRLSRMKIVIYYNIGSIIFLVFSIIISSILIIGRSELDTNLFIYLFMCVIFGFCHFRIRIVSFNNTEEKVKNSNNQTLTD